MFRGSLVLIVAVLIGSCNCTTEIKGYPPDTSCTPGNLSALHDETIPELCDGIDNNCNCLEKPLEEQDTNGDLKRCSFGDEGVDEGCNCYPPGSVEWAVDDRICWLDEEGREVGTLASHVTEVGKLMGECEYGKQICRPLPEGGSAWGIWLDGPDRTGGTDDDKWITGGCLGTIGPATEICDSKDNNCDGRVDEGLKKMCWSGPSDPDGTPQDWLVFNDPLHSFTQCQIGIELCENGRWSGCMHEILPANETCNGLDDDCDGVVDDHPEYQGDQCGLTDLGICDYGALDCVSADLICLDPLLPENETCDGLDNDCDGTVDEDLFQPCETLCGSGIESCSSGIWGGCTAQQPQEEICDAMDNDCDGLVDEDLECSCPPEFIGMLLPCQSNPQLVCGTGFMECRCTNADCTETAFTECQALCVYEPQVQEDCDPTLGEPIPEVCNAWDDDCDEEIDEGLIAECYTGPPGTLNIGICSAGELVCKLGRWGNESDGNVFIDGLCLNQVLPEEEVCDHQDNDCDGDIDEDLDSHEKVDMVFAIDRSGSMCNKIQALRQGIQPYVLEFANTPHRFALVNIPGVTPGVQNRWQYPPDLEINLTDSLTFSNALAALSCNYNNEEPQYDAVVDIGRNTLNLAFRNDAWPMVVVLSDEHAQTFHGYLPNDVNAAIDPCTVGNCEQGDKLEVFSIVPQNFFSQWCSPADIAKQCYSLYFGIDAATIKGYLDDIFSDVCRGGENE